MIIRFEELLQARQFIGLGRNRWTLFYINLAKELGLTYKSRVIHHEIHYLLKSKWSGTMFEDQFFGSDDESWLTHLFRKHRRSFHPLRHLLVTTALSPDLPVKLLFEKVRSFPDRLPKSLPTEKKKIVSECAINEYRTKWINIKEENPNVGVKVLRRIRDGGATYAWLFKHDKDWLMLNRPVIQSTSNVHYRINYKCWDINNLSLLELTYQNMISIENRKRLTRSRFIKALPRSSSVEKHLNKLPKTARWISRHEESIEDYQLYRLYNARDSIIGSNLTVNRWRLLRFANIREEYVTPKIEIEIQNIVKGN